MKNWKERLTAPAEALAPRTLTEIYGMERVLVERHRGIVSYGTETIRIGTDWGFLVVEGRDLRLCCMSRNALVIRGRIMGLNMEER